MENHADKARKKTIADLLLYLIGGFLCSLLSSWSVLNRLGQMRRSDLFTPRQVSNRPRDFEHTMKRPRAELELLASRRRAHERLPCHVELKDAHVGGPLRVSALHTM